MNYQLKEITRTNYYTDDCEELFSHDRYSHRFAKLKFPDCQYKFNWQSDLIEPKLLELNHDTLFLGIDLYAAVVNTKVFEIHLLEKQHSFFLEAFVLNENLIFISQLSCTIYSIEHMVIEKKYDFSDMYLDHETVDGGVQITMQDGNVLII
ncbi:hypothetical protein J7384_09255 [Endozoicomonas sp. G2_1]|uniref:hypothetical protein n=1 Tax=Endozoicomonas sp. G2_1 TaxID=2821091 RepID=UPI001AD9B3EE|nr:hypothetical protein [Endozoicomonas sp. G2_1]MBO9490550.1 hypothetical protein [Endozoicomonas sp. G2_1]